MNTTLLEKFATDMYNNAGGYNDRPDLIKSITTGRSDRDTDDDGYNPIKERHMQPIPGAGAFSTALKGLGIGTALLGYGAVKAVKSTGRFLSNSGILGAAASLGGAGLRLGAKGAIRAGRNGIAAYKNFAARNASTPPPPTP